MPLIRKVNGLPWPSPSRQAAAKAAPTLKNRKVRNRWLDRGLWRCDLARLLSKAGRHVGRNRTLTSPSLIYAIPGALDLSGNIRKLTELAPAPDKFSPRPESLQLHAGRAWTKTLPATTIPLDKISRRKPRVRFGVSYPWRADCCDEESSQSHSTAPC